MIILEVSEVERRERANEKAIEQMQKQIKVDWLVY